MTADLTGRHQGAPRNLKKDWFSIDSISEKWNYLEFGKHETENPCYGIKTQFWELYRWSNASELLRICTAAWQTRTIVKFLFYTKLESEESKYQIRWGQRDKERDRQRNGKARYENKTLKVTFLHPKSCYTWICDPVVGIFDHILAQNSQRHEAESCTQNHLALISCFISFMVFSSSCAFMTWLPRGIIAAHAVRTWSPSPRWCSSWAAWHFKSKAMDKDEEDWIWRYYAYFLSSQTCMLQLLMISHHLISYVNRCPPQKPP